MLKCVVIVLCAITIVFCAPGYENLREKQSARQLHMADQSSGTSRMKRQSLGSVEVVYVDAASLNPIKLRDLQNKESFPPAPVNDVTNPRENIRQLSGNNLEVVTQNSNYIVYKLKTTDEWPLNGLPVDKRAQGSENQFYGYDSEQYSGYSGVKNPPPPAPPDDRKPPPPHPPPHHHPPPTPLDHYPATTHHHHSPPPPPPDDYDRSNNYDRYNYYNRPLRGPPPHYGGPPHRHGPPDRYDRGPPPPRDGPPDRYDHRPPPHHGGPPHRFDDRPPPPRDRYDNRPPPAPNRYDDRPYQRPPSPPKDHRPPPGQDPYYDQSNGNNEYSQDDEPSTAVTLTSSTTEAESDDDQYQLDVRFNNDEQNPVETMKRDVTVLPTARPLSSFIFQATAVTPVD